MSTSPAESPPSPPDPDPSVWDYRPGFDPEGSPWEQEQGAMDAEDRYLRYLEGPNQ